MHRTALNRVPQYLATERRYPPEISARAMGYNNVVIALAGAVGPYLLAQMVSLGVKLLTRASKLLLRLMLIWCIVCPQGSEDELNPDVEAETDTSRYLTAKSCLQCINLLSGVFPWLLWRDSRAKH